MKDAFKNLHSVHELVGVREDHSTNDFVNLCTPGLKVIAFNDSRSLDTIKNDFDQLSLKYKVSESFGSYSKKSPGYKKHIGRNYVISQVVILNRGIVRHMYSGTVEVHEHQEFTLRIFLTGLLLHLNSIQLPRLDLLNYLNWVMVREINDKKGITRATRLT
jgi:hypothetical protein